MFTYLLKWNPKKWPWTTLPQDMKEVRQRGFWDSRWTCGNNKRIWRGSRVFLLRTGIEPRGIIGSGVVTDEPSEGVHYDPERSRDTALYIGVRFDTLLHPDDLGLLAVKQFQSGPLADFFTRTQHAPSSGNTIPPEAAADLETAWSVFLTTHGQKPIFLADEITTPARFFEGATRQISVNTYERNPYARQQCIERYGCRCSVCGFDFEAVYGGLGRGFIHVHHLKPLSDIREEYEINPIEDLRPICPNCHAMIHRNQDMMGIEGLKTLKQQFEKDSGK